MRPTVEGALAIRRPVEQEAPKRRFLVFNASGGQPPLVLFPGLCGSPASFRGLPEALGTDQPLYLADSLDIEAPQELLVASIEHMADAYETDLQRLCPTRTLILGGYSFGMLLVLELARRLLTHGYSVPLLVSLESAAPNYPKFLPTKQRVLAHLREIGFGEQRRYIADRLSNTYRRLLRSLHREYLLIPHVQASSSEVRQITKRLFDVSIEAIERYQPRFTVETDLLFFQAHTPERRIGVQPHDPQAGWSSYIGGNITVVPVAGEHGTILNSTYRGVIARRYQQHIEALGLAVQKTPQSRA
ncbi:MAG TPA: thioesterase domain-containing protein [Polyangiaceae bacterium]|nr:thioesterase domain-containing protein [Polyangiaceae bacterium]